MPIKRDSSGRFTSGSGGSGLKPFADRMRKHAKGVVTNTNTNVIRLAALIHQTLVVATPVDTGRARANWQVGLGVEPTGELTEQDPGGQGTIAKAVSVLSTRKSEQTIHIANNVPYIKRLNEGWSAQAPAAFVEQAIDTAIQGFRTAKVIK